MILLLVAAVLLLLVVALTVIGAISFAAFHRKSWLDSFEAHTSIDLMLGDNDPFIVSM